MTRDDHTSGPEGPTEGGPDWHTLLGQVWPRRFSDPQAVTALIADAPPTPERAVLEGFAAWRRQQHDEALAAFGPALADGALDRLWSGRARALMASSFLEIGLYREALDLLRLAIEDAEAAADPVLLCDCVHDLGVLYHLTEPRRALEQWRQAIALARRYRSRSLEHALDSFATEALAVSNVHDLCGSTGLPLPEGLPSLEDAEELAEIAWPDLAISLRAARSVASLEAGDVETCRTLVARLPHPDTLDDPRRAEVVVQARARLDAHDGHYAAAVDALESVVARLPHRFVSGPLRELVTVHRQAGNVQGALDAALRIVDALARLEDSETRTAIRALEVWMRTHEAEAKAAAAEEAAAELRGRMAELHREREQLRVHRDRDVLTGLWNRHRLEEVIGRLDGQDGHEVAVIDLDRFKDVNDTDGHLAGDDTLRRFAEALHDVCGPDDTLVRYGGDEFVVVRPCGAGGRLEADLAPLARLEAHSARGAVLVRSSIGVTRTTSDGFAAALHEADRRMYAAKRSGGGCIVAMPIA